MNLRVIIILLCLAAVAPAQRSAGSAALDTSALGALKLLPKDMAKRVARIEARGGNPWPSRWYVLVFEPSEPRGLREFAFADGKQVAARTLSQFADTLGEGDVVGADSVKINSDTAAGIAGKFALQNGVRLGSVDYELRKLGEPAVPAWRLTCLSMTGDQLGSVVIDAKKGSVISYDGFATSPYEEAPAPVAPKDKPTTSAPPAKPKATAVAETKPAKPTKPTSAPAAKPAARDSSVTKPFRDEPPPKPGTMKRIGNSVKKIFGRDE